MEVVNSPGLDQVRISHADLDLMELNSRSPEQDLLVWVEDIWTPWYLLIGRRPWTEPHVTTLQVVSQRVDGG